MNKIKGTVASKDTVKSAKQMTEKKVKVYTKEEIEQAEKANMVHGLLGRPRNLQSSFKKTIKTNLLPNIAIIVEDIDRARVMFENKTKEQVTDYLVW